MDHREKLSREDHRMSQTYEGRNVRTLVEIVSRLQQFEGSNDAATAPAGTVGPVVDAHAVPDASSPDAILRRVRIEVDNMVIYAREDEIELA